MKVTCPSCKREIPPEDINIQSAIAKCSACGELFTITDNLPSAAAPVLVKPQVPMPKNFALFHEMDALVLLRRWFNWGVIPLAFFCIIWDSFIIFFYTMIFRTHAPIFIMLFPSLHLAVGLFLTYIVLTGFFNTTQVRITGSNISVLHGPLPWPGNKNISTLDIQQVYCIQSFNSSSNYNNRRSSPSYDVCVMYQSGNREKLIGGIDQADQARYIEQQIESTLGIADTAIAGELGAV